MVRWFSTREGRDEIQKLFYLVRRTLQALAPPSREDAERRAAEGAAVALFCHAATRLVDQAVAQAQATHEKDHIRHVPTSELFVCAVIATSIFGGELHLKPALPRGMRQPEHVFEVRVPAGGDQETEVFERAAYAAVFPNDRDTPHICLESGPLTRQQREDLAARIGEIQDQERAIALVVHGLPRHEAARALADEHKLPVLLPSELATPLLGMTPERLHAEFGELWRLLDPPPGAPPESPPAPISSPSPGGTPMTTSGQPPVFQFTGNPTVAISTGDHSAAAAGTGQTVRVAHTQGVDLAVLGPLLQALAEAIRELPSPKARDPLAAHVRDAQVEAAKKDQADPGRVRRFIDAIKSAAEALEGGEKIVMVCSKAHELLAPFLGLPGPP